MHVYRTHTCGALRDADVGETVRLSGWVHRKRDHGHLLFLDLRDDDGLTQCVVEPDSEHFTTVEGIAPESVVTVTGAVVARTADTVNPNIPTGTVEVRIRDFGVQSEAAELPLPVFGEQEYPEEIRLKHRFIDLRRERLHRNIKLRSAIIDSIRRRMIAQGFTEFQTPILTASSPEGARDFLVPSRLHPGKFYALPQAPQQFKQLYMVAGFDRYFQIAPCFRDEDARADRSPGEFYQLDVEMSFVQQDDVLGAIEPVIHGVFDEFAGERTVTAAPFPLLAYAQAPAALRHRQARPQESVGDRRCHRSVSRLGVRDIRPGDRRGRHRAGDPCARRREPAAELLRQGQRLGARGRLGGPWLYRLCRGRGQGADRPQSRA